MCSMNVGSPATCHIKVTQVGSRLYLANNASKGANPSSYQGHAQGTMAQTKNLL